MLIETNYRRLPDVTIKRLTALVTLIENLLIDNFDCDLSFSTLHFILILWLILLDSFDNSNQSKKIVTFSDVFWSNLFRTIRACVGLCHFLINTLFADMVLAREETIRSLICLIEGSKTSQAVVFENNHEFPWDSALAKRSHKNKYRWKLNTCLMI